MEATARIADKLSPIALDADMVIIYVYIYIKDS